MEKNNGKNSPEQDETILRFDPSALSDTESEEGLEEQIGELEEELEDIEDEIDDLSDELDELKESLPPGDSSRYAAAVKKMDGLIAALHTLEVRRDELIGEIARLEETLW